MLLLMNSINDFIMIINFLTLNNKSLFVVVVAIDEASLPY